MSRVSYLVVEAPLRTLSAVSTASEDVSTARRGSPLPQCDWRGGGGGVGFTGTAGFGGSAGFNGESGGSLGAARRGKSSFCSRIKPCTH